MVYNERWHLVGVLRTRYIAFNRAGWVLLDEDRPNLLNFVSLDIVVHYIVVLNEFYRISAAVDLEAHCEPIVSDTLLWRHLGLN